MKLKEYIPSFVQSLKLRFGSSNNKDVSLPTVPIIVSLTSIPSRLKTIHLTILSLLAQSVRPQKIVLWLHEDLKAKLPSTLSRLQSNRFEINYVSLTCSHRKLIHSIEKYPDSIIVTSDDDLMYEQRWLERLFETHKKHPEDIIAHECRRLARDTGGKLLPYKQWPTSVEPGESEDNIFFIGYGGVLYPPNSLYKDTVNENLFLKLAPKADDLWFKAMAQLQGTRVRRSENPQPKPTPVIGSQKFALGDDNIKKDLNVNQWRSIEGFYSIKI